MDRRTFLRSTATVTGLGLAAAWPDWLARAFGDEGGQEKDSRAGEVAAAFARARQDRRPLLVLVIPAEEKLRHGRGQIFGEVIHHGGPGALDDLLLCEIVCATVKDVATALPHAAVQGEPLMLLVEAHEVAGALPAPVPIDPRIQLDVPARFDEREATEKAIRERIDTVKEALHAAVLPKPDSLAERARRSRDALVEAERKALEEICAGKRATEPELVRRGAAGLLLAANAAAPETRDRVRRALDDAGEKLVRKGRPAGAKWASSSGCGIEIEGEHDGFGVACGMGYVPEMSRRFLWFFTE
jgi:hypothetical protein